MDPDDVLALQLLSQADQLGWELVMTLRPLRLTRWQGEMLLLRLDWLERWRTAQRQSGPRQTDEVQA